MAEDRLTPPGIRGPSLFIISGYRSPETQARVNPSVTRSCHVQCPSLAADLRVGSIEGLESVEVWTIIGGLWGFEFGGRWGGRFSSDDPAEINIAGINTREMNHFDLGPCL